MADTKWHHGHELRLVPGAHECDKKLTQMILEILKKDFKFDGAKIFDTFPKSPESERYTPKPKRSMVIGQFNEREEVRADVGQTTLSDLLRRDAIYFITHPYNKDTNVDVNTTIWQMLTFGDLLKSQDAEVKQLTLVTSVSPYDLQHSVKRRLREGLVESRGLKMFLELLAQFGYKEIITIAPHSNKTKEIANDLGMYFRGIDPFRPESCVSSLRLGPFLYQTPDNTQKREDYDAQITRLTPFVTWLKKRFSDNIDDIYFVAPDDGSEDTIEQITYALRGDKQHILAIKKDRDQAEWMKVLGTKDWSTARPEDIQGKTCILVDDRGLSWRTINETAYDLKKNLHAGKIVGLLAHDLSYNSAFRDNDAVDQLVCLETNPGSPLAQGTPDPRVERMPLETTATLLASQIFGSYVALRCMGKQKVR